LIKQFRLIQPTPIKICFKHTYLNPKALFKAPFFHLYNQLNLRRVLFCN